MSKMKLWLCLGFKTKIKPKDSFRIATFTVLSLTEFGVMTVSYEART